MEQRVLCLEGHPEVLEDRLERLFVLLCFHLLQLFYSVLSVLEGYVAVGVLDGVRAGP